ncbi:MAG: flagellar protein FlgN [Defluviitaleaceae bacterium]|nr:flagellar protein FlgN [Defluviitaleaceae bacterium]
MASLIQDLIENLDNQLALYEDLITLSKNKKECIIKNDVEDLKKITKIEGVVVSRLSRFDKDCFDIIKDIATVLNRKQDNLTLSSIADTISNQPEHPRFIEQIGQIKTAIKKLAELNEDNKILIANVLDFIDFNINVMRPVMGADSPVKYPKSGEEIRESASFLDING